MFLEHAAYNANCNEMCHVAIRFEMPPGGGAVPFINIRCAPLMQYATVMDYWILGHEILFSVSTFMLTANEALLLLRRRSTLRVLFIRAVRFILRLYCGGSGGAGLLPWLLPPAPRR